MQQIANAIQSQNNTISIEYNSFIHIQGRKKGRNTRQSKVPLFSRAQDREGAAQHRGQCPPSPQCPGAAAPSPQPDRGNNSSVQNLTHTHHLTQLSALSRPHLPTVATPLIISLHVWVLIWEINKHNCHRITEYWNLEGPHKNLVQVPAPHRTT